MNKKRKIIKDYEPHSINEESKNLNPEASYYDEGGITLKEIMEAKLGFKGVIGFYKGNALKYIIRAGNKNGEDARKDIGKAIDYLNDLRRIL